MDLGDVRRLVSDFRIALDEIYGPRLRGVFLYGSYARGDADEESDVDVLVVLDDFDRYGEEISRTAEAAANLSLRYGVSLSRVFARERDWLCGDTVFLSNAREEGVAARRTRRRGCSPRRNDPCARPPIC
jgi:type I restriction enzyme S subunit